MKRLRATAPRRYTSLDELPAMMSVKDVSNLLGLSMSKTYMLTSSQGFPKLNLGGKRGRVLVPKAQFIEWLEANIAQ